MSGKSSAFAAICLMVSRISLPPLISACMLPVLIQTESWVYPAAVLVMSVLVAVGQRGMEKQGRRDKIKFTAVIPRKKDLLRWLKLLAALLLSFSMIFFQKCYQWDRPRLIYCLAPAYLKKRLKRDKRNAGPGENG